MLEVIKFELKYRLRRPATYIYFAILLLLSFFVVVSPIVQAGGSGGRVMENAPVVIANLMLALSWIGLLISSAVMGVPVLRDFEHSSASILFTTPLKKWEYLLGRYLGSFLILILIASGILLGTMIGHAVPWPWLDNADKMMPFTAYHYIHPFIVFIIPNLFIFGSIFFSGGTLGKKMTVVYAQAIILFMGYLVAEQFLSELDNRDMAALLDPFGFGANAVITQYWTVAEQNTRLIPLSGVLLTNRLIWMGIGLAFLVLTFVRFNYNMVGKAGKKARGKKADKPEQVKDLFVPKVVRQFGAKASLIQIKELAIFYFKWMVKQLPFIFIAMAGISFILIVSFASGTGSYDIETYYTTQRVISLLSAFNLFFIVLIVFYTGEMIWKERDIKINLIYDALPYPNYVSLIGKYLGFLLVHVATLVVLWLLGMVIQVLKGYPTIDFALYVEALFGDTLILLALYTFLGFFLQTLVNHKFLGFALMIIFYISLLVMSELGIEHTMFYFARDGLGTYSEMNQYGHFLTPFSWFNLYWVALAMTLFALSIVFSVRGTETVLKNRLKVGKASFTRPLILFLLGAIVVFVSSAFYIYYNTNMVNEYENSDERNALRADYEKGLKQYEFLPQPKIVATHLTVDIYPKDRDFDAKGYYIVKNKTDKPISAIHIQRNTDHQFETEVSFKKDNSVKVDFDKFNYTVYEFKEPLQPGEEVKMDFTVKFRTKGFVESGSNTSVIYNGTFFNNSYFPSIGYNSGFEISDDDDREDNGLEKKERMMDRDDPRGLAASLFGDDADKIQFEITIGTDSSQIAIAPGYLQKKWTEGDRAYYHYKMDTPMVNFYSIVSAEYQVMKDVWEPPAGSLPEVDLEIYYHKGHGYNLERMMRGMKKALDYYSTNFSPYQFRQLRIMEFPRYSSFAQSFANTVPFSEGIGFIQKIGDDDVDLPFYVTAHEVAHQWWGHQVTEAGVKGNAMLSETMSQYSALMVMKQEYPPEQIKKFLEHELNSYLFGRTFERKKEMPLELVESQGYIHYRKGSVIMYALQDYIGEDSVNAALKRFNKEWAFKEGKYPTSKDLIGYFREVTPDSLQYLIIDMFETITLFENKTTEATYEVMPDNTYKIEFTVNAVKYRADSLGNETSIPLKDWIDIGVFGKDEDGEDKLLYLQKHKIDAEEKSFTITVYQKPVKAGIDPINKLIDRNPDDNVKTLVKKEEKGEPDV